MDTLFGESEPENSVVEKNYVNFAQIAIEQSIDLSPKGLTYGIPEDLAHVQVGQRVLVPLGRKNQMVRGYITAIDPVSPTRHKTKAISGIDEQDLVLPEPLIELARWMASYYVTPLGMVLAGMLPAAVKKGVGLKKKYWIRLNAAATEVEMRKPSRIQQAILDRLAEQDERSPWIEQKSLLESAGAKTTGPLKGLIKKERVLREQGYKPPQDTPKPSITLARPQNLLDKIEIDEALKPVLSDEQRAALEALTPTLDQFKVSLLFGVTGSGKTEVYLRLIEEVLSRGQSAIVLVPEIALTPQTASRFTHRFSQAGIQVAILHSRLKNSDRQAQWRAIRKGQIRLVIGARSAVMAPVHDLGLIVVDEEHDTSYKQDQLPRYHARDVAIRRCHMLNRPVVLGSATPSLESFANCQKHDAYQLLSMKHRVGGAVLPNVNIVDLREDRKERYQLKKSGTADSPLAWHLISLPLEKALRHAFENNHQAILLLNRRGYANYIACPDQFCGWSLQCDYCDAAMVYHRQQPQTDVASLAVTTGGQMRCHHCGAETLLPRLCPVCGKKLTVFGLGTQRVEEEFKTLFPGIGISRMDSDTMRQMDDYQSTLEAFRNGETQLLLGTQMIAKGLDFPNVTVVGVISSDTALNLPDFRATERTYQLISQVAGRAGRGLSRGSVYLQTLAPDDPTIIRAGQTDYLGFANRELQLREKAGYPPSTRMIRIIVRDLDREKARGRATELKSQMATVINRIKLTAGKMPANASQSESQSAFQSLRIIGPGPCAIERVAEFHRFEMLLFSESAGELQQLMTGLRSQFKVKSDYGLAIDVDPVSLL